MTHDADEVAYVVLNATPSAPSTRLLLDEVQVLVWSSARRTRGCRTKAATTTPRAVRSASATSIAPFCSCVQGFSPVNQSQWPGGCRREVQLECGTTDLFIVVHGVKLPDTNNATVDVSATPLLNYYEI